jgi:AraC-like DNA-binding protein
MTGLSGWHPFHFTYKRRVVVILIAVLLLVMVGFSVVVYDQASQQLVTLYEETDLLVLEQLQRNVTLIDNTVTNALIAAFFDPDVASAAYLETQDLRTLSRAQSALRKLLTAPNDYVEAVHLYIRAIDTVVSVGGYQPDASDYAELKRFAASSPKLVPLLREYDNPIVGTPETGPEQVLSYVMYGQSPDEARSGIIVVDVRPDWILDSLEALNESRRSEQDQLFLYFGNRLIGPRRGRSVEPGIADEMPSIFPRAVRAAPSSTTARMAGQRLFLSVASVPETELWFARSRPFSNVASVLTNLRSSFVLATAIAVLVGLAAAIVAGRLIYRPVRELVIDAKRLLPEIRDEEGDDIAFLRALHTSSARAIDRARKSELGNEARRKALTLRTLIFDGIVENQSRDEIASTLGFGTEEALTLCVLRVAPSTRSNLDAELYSTSAPNLVLERALRSAFGHDLHAMTRVASDTLVLVVPTEQLETAGDVVVDRLNRGRSTLRKRIGRVTAIAASDGTDSLDTLSEAYRFTSEATEYAYQYGFDGIISTELIAPNLVNQDVEVPPEAVASLEQAIVEGNIDAALESVDALLGAARLLRADVVRLALMAPLLRIRGALQRRYVVLTAEMRSQLELLYQELHDAETLMIFGHMLKDTLRTLLDDDLELRETNPMVRATYAIIHEEYADPSLYIPEIAARLTVTPKHLGQVFREETGSSIPEYLNDYRMEQAASLIERRNLLVSDVMKQVGIENESHFYRSFKRRFGMTPRNYALRHRV